MPLPPLLVTLSVKHLSQDQKQTLKQIAHEIYEETKKDPSAE